MQYTTLFGYMQMPTFLAFGNTRCDEKSHLWNRGECDKIRKVNCICACDGIGRHAGFRFPCFRRVGSSPFRRTKEKKDIQRMPFFSYACENVKVVIWWYSSPLRSSVEGKWD